jgi:hypothetical protein
MICLSGAHPCKTYFWLHHSITTMTGNIGEVIYHDKCQALVMQLLPVSSFSHMKIRHVLRAWHCTPTLPDNDNNALLQTTSHTTWLRTALLQCPSSRLHISLLLKRHLCSVITQFHVGTPVVSTIQNPIPYIYSSIYTLNFPFLLKPSCLTSFAVAARRG